MPSTDSNYESSLQTMRRQLIDAVANSQTFENAPVTRNLLLYLFAHNGENLNEYVIATEALGRRQDFEPRTDSSVRVQISRLRSKLAEYASHEGVDSQWEIILPRASYSLEFIDKRPQGDSAVEEAKNNANTENEATRGVDSRVFRSGWTGNIRRALPVVVSVILTAVLTFFLSHREVRSGQAPAAGSRISKSFDKTSFWPRIVTGNETVRIVIPNLIFFRWTDEQSGDSIHVRSVTVNSFDNFADSKFLKQLSRLWGKPELSQEYLSVYDARSMSLLTFFMQAHGIKPLFSMSSEYPVDSMDKETVILLGTGTTLQRYGQILSKMSLHFESTTTAITWIDPKSGHMQVFKPQQESTEVSVIPQVLACLPTGPGGGKALVIAGFRNQAVLHYITSDEGQREIGKRLNAESSPYFEAVILSEMNGDTPLHSSVAFFRSIPLRH